MRTPRTFALSHIRFVTVPAVSKKKGVPMDWNLEISMWGRGAARVDAGERGEGGGGEEDEGVAKRAWQPLTVFDYRAHNGGVGAAPAADEQSLLFRLDDAGVRVCGDVKVRARVRACLQASLLCSARSLPLLTPAL